MSATEVKQYFDDYIFGFIFADLEREIAFVKSQVEIVGGFRVPKIIGGSNFLGALGLLCYTEFMGGILTGSFSRGRDKSRFDAFFNTLGPDYEAFNRRINVYKVFRCGMVHEYFVKKSAVIYMLDGQVNQWATSDGVVAAVSGAPSMLIGPVQCGIGMLDEARYYFVVERYYKDFADACRTAYAKIMSNPNPTIPSDVG